MTSTEDVDRRRCASSALRSSRIALIVWFALFHAEFLHAQEHLALFSGNDSMKDGLFIRDNNSAASDSIVRSLDIENRVGKLDGLWGMPRPGSLLIPDGLVSESDFVSADSFPRPTTRRLLPANISFMEKAMWGENGFFRTAGFVPPLTPEERQSELTLRRGMLSLHQIGGFATLGLMMATAYYGQRSIDNNSNRTLRSDHQTFVAATIVSYSATGLLAILSPPPLIRRDEVSTTTIHKTLAWVHAAGMIITPILGSMIGRHRDSQRAHIHQIAGYFTTATFAASMITVTF